MTERQLGNWFIARTIVDSDIGGTVECRGRATLERDAGRLRYDEAVTVRLGERTVRATRTYFYCATGEALAATFEDGRPFFVTTLGTDGIGTAVHPCGDDLYVGTITLRVSDWATRWNVTGTKKLCITTHYTRNDAQVIKAAPLSDVGSPSLDRHIERVVSLTSPGGFPIRRTTERIRRTDQAPLSDPRSAYYTSTIAP